jgi:hypothetical protein
MHIIQPTQLPHTDPLPIINNFFDQYELDECQREIWNLLIAAFDTSQSDIWGQRCSSNAIFFCKNVDTLLKGLFKVWQEKQGTV